MLGIVFFSTAFPPLSVQSSVSTSSRSGISRQCPLVRYPNIAKISAMFLLKNVCIANRAPEMGELLFPIDRPNGVRADAR